MADADVFAIDPVERALSLLVQSARVSPPLRDAVQVVEDEIRRLRRGPIEDIFARTAPTNVTVCPTCGGEGTVRLDG